MDAPLGGLSTLLDVVSQSPHPDEVARAIVEGPGARMGATSAAVLWANYPKLIILGSHGYRAPEISGLAYVDISRAYPLTHAYMESEVIITPTPFVEERYPAMGRSGSRWHHLKERIPDGDHVSAPIHSRGRTIGAFALNCPESRDWSSLELATLSGVSHALGMWMSHPDSGIPVASDGVEVAAGILTERQRQILVMVNEGRTNASIGHALGLSVSTVKQEMARVLVALDVPDRVAAVRQAQDLGLLAVDQP